MFDEISKWLDDALNQEILHEVAAFCFNLYEDGGNRWFMEIVGTRENCFTWEVSLCR